MVSGHFLGGGRLSGRNLLRSNGRDNQSLGGAARPAGFAASGELPSRRPPNVVALRSVRLRVINALVYYAVAVGALALIAAPLRASFRTLVREWSYAPGLAWPWLWLSLAGGVLLLVLEITRRAVRGLPVGMWRYAALLLLTLGCLAARRSVPVPPRPALQDGMAQLLARVEAAADEAWARDRTYPEDPARLEGQWPHRLRDLGFRGRFGRAVHSRVVVVKDAYDPALRPPPGTRPGDVVFALDATRRRFWATAFVLDRHGRLTPASGAGGRALIAAAWEGRPASRRDPLFPEYPNRAGGKPPPGARRPSSEDREPQGPGPQGPAPQDPPR